MGEENRKRLSIYLNEEEQRLIQLMINQQDRKFSLGQFIKHRIFDSERLTPKMKAIMNMEFSIVKTIEMNNVAMASMERHLELFKQSNKKMQHQLRELEKIKK